MTYAVLKTPSHPWKQLKRFSDMSETNYHQACCAYHLEKET